MNKERVDKRRAIEALRAGVPNRDVVRQLPPAQKDMEDKFAALLSATEKDWQDGKQATGLLIAGEFGAGKTHWLEYFRHLAFEDNFVCSQVVINKETPLSDLAKIYRACVTLAAIPGKVGPALDEIVHTYHSDRAPHYRDFHEWAHETQGLDPRFAATLILFARTNDEEIRGKILAEWTGYPMKLPDLRRALKEIGELQNYPVGKSDKGQLLQRFEFMARFFLSAGYSGWLVLFDETEMISKYSLRQRARAYAHLAELLGLAKNDVIPGLATVFTITRDFTGLVLHGKKDDLNSIPNRLVGTRDEPYIAAARIGMNALLKRGIDMRAPTREQVREIYRKVREMYSSAYDWPAPEQGGRGFEKEHQHTPARANLDQHLGYSAVIQ